MKRLSMSNKIAGILTTLSIFPILVAGWVGVLPIGDEELMQRRASLSEQLANSCAAQIAALYASQNPAPTVTGNLVADYAFNGNAEDETDYNNDAVESWAQLTTDRFGKNNKAYA